MSTTRPARAVRYIVIPSAALLLAVLLSWQLLPVSSAPRGLPQRPAARGVIAGRVIAASVARRGGYVEIATPLAVDGLAVRHISVLRLGPESMLSLGSMLPRVPLFVLTALSGDSAADHPRYLNGEGASVEVLAERRGDELYALAVRPVRDLQVLQAPGLLRGIASGAPVRFEAAAGEWRESAGTRTVDVSLDVPGEPGRTWYAIDAEVSGAATMTTPVMRRTRVAVRKPYEEFERGWAGVRDASATVEVARHGGRLRVLSVEATPRVGPAPDDVVFDDDPQASPILGLTPGAP